MNAVRRAQNNSFFFFFFKFFFSHNFISLVGNMHPVPVA